MTQNPQGWGQQGGPPQGQPPQYQPGGYPPPSQPGGYPPGGGYAQPGGYRPQGAYQPQPPYGAQPGYPPQGQPGYGPQGGGGAGFGAGQPPKKSQLSLIVMVVAAVALVAAIGGVFLALSNNDGDQPVTSITPAQPSAPPSTDEPSGDPSPSTNRSDDPSSSEPTPSGTDQPRRDAVDLGNGIALTPASGWTVKKTGDGVAQLSDGDSIFLGQATKISGSTNPGQLCTAWHKQVAEETSGGKFADPKDISLGSTKVKGATCTAQVTLSSGQGSANVFLFSLVSVRQSDGVTVLGTTYFPQNADSEKLAKDFETMMNSMLRTQI